MTIQKILLLKTISYRLVASIATALIVWAVFGTLKLAIGAGAIELIVKPIIYYLHELAWLNTMKKSGKN